MPRKQTAEGLRIDPEVELRAWRMTFKSGYDYLRDLRKIGVPDGDRHQPPRELVEDAWRRLGRAFLDGRASDAVTTSTERELGRPEDMSLSPSRRESGARRRVMR